MCCGRILRSSTTRRNSRRFWRGSRRESCRSFILSPRLRIAKSSDSSKLACDRRRMAATGRERSATSKDGTGSDASGVFNVGTSTILWTVTDVHGNTSAATTVVTVNPALSISIPDVYALNPMVDQKNTIYLGYGPASLTVRAGAQGGTSPYWYAWNTAATTDSIRVSAAGTYMVTVTDSAGCTTMDSLVIDVLDVRCGNDSNKVTVCHNGNTICVSPNAVPAHLDHGDHLGGCTSSCVVGATNFYADGKAFGDSSLITVYPNPVSESFTIQLGTLTPGAIMQLFDPSGVLIKMDRLVNPTQMVSAQALAAGVYYLVIKNGESVFTTKIIKL